MPVEYQKAAQSEWTKNLAVISEAGNSKLSDLFTSEKDCPDKPVTCGFYRQEKGTPLVYTYDYEEMKIILEGTFEVTDDTGTTYIGKPGDVFHFHNGDKITFTSPDYGLAFFCGQKKFNHV